MTLEIVAGRIAELEKQMTAVLAKLDEKTEVTASVTKPKKEKKEKSDEPNKKRGVSGYLVYAKEMRQSAKESLVENGNETPKPTEVLTQVAKMWRELDDEEREEWNAKAKTINLGSGSEDEEAKEAVEEPPKKEKKPKKAKKDEN